MMRKVLPLDQALPLFDRAASRSIEHAALQHRPHLMQDAGLAVAKLALALFEGHGSIWVACGPGHNGDDGRIAAGLLQAMGLSVSLADAPPADTTLVIDALFGLGLSRPISGPMATCIAHINALDATVLSVDLPSGLDTDKGTPLGCAVHADHTLALLTLKPGLFTGAGRAYVGQVWFDDLGERTTLAPTAQLLGRDCMSDLWQRTALAHKGTQGDVHVAAGSMIGAARLAARSSLAAGAGRVYVETGDEQRPELLSWDGQRMDTLVAGCGGGTLIAARLPSLIAGAARLVLDADALNTIAADATLAQALVARTQPTVLTPHPLEAARLLVCRTEAVQADRMAAAQALAERFGCTVVLKGSGTVIAAPGHRPAINGSGSPALATAGTGDVLAGWIAGLWAQEPSRSGFEIACAAVHWHGLAGETQNAGPLRAADLIERMHDLRPA